MAKQPKKPDMWHVYQLGNGYHVLSDSDLAKMDTQERAAYQLVQSGFATSSDAMAHAGNLGGGGKSAQKKPDTD